MGFAGNLRTFPLAEVVQTIGRIQASGALQLVNGETSRQVVFKDGEIIGVALPAGAERRVLLQRMIMQGVIGSEEAHAISQGGSPSQVLEALIDNHLVTREEVAEAARVQAEEEVFHVFTWEVADFTFRDAGPEEPEIEALVQRHLAGGLRIGINGVLMEAARRADEYGRLRERIGDPDQVPGPAQGRDQELQAAGAAFPASAVVPLIDAVRSVEDIAAAAVVTRLDVYGVLVELIDAGLVCWLSQADLEAHADWLVKQGDHARAAQLLRRVLTGDPKDHASRTLLATCLEHLGAGAEAAASYDHIARLVLEEGDLPMATAHARRAVELASGDARPRKTLARCLIQAGELAGAVSLLREILALHLEAGKLEEARSVCLQILELDKADEQARRELARIFSRVEHDQHSEDVVVCIQCGHINHREAATCSACKATLQLSCLSCGRVVGVSDRLCIFCGADPHGGGSRRPGGAPATSRVIRRGSKDRIAAAEIAAEVRLRAGQTSGPRLAAGAEPAHDSASERAAQVERLVGEAQACEEGEDIARALVLWRQVSSLQPDIPSLQSHLKVLEAKLHEQAIEHEIEAGHRMRRGRHCFGAVNAYRKALRLLSATDPRIKPVGEALARAERDRLRISLVYSATGLVLCSLGWFAMEPFYVGWRFQGEADSLREEISQVRDPAGLAPVNEIFDHLTKTAASLPGGHGRRARRILDDVDGDLQAVQARLAQAELDRLAKAIAQRDAAAAQALADNFQARFRGAALHEGFRVQLTSLNALKTQLRMRDDESKSAPARLEAAIQLEKDRRLAEALVSYRALMPTSNPAAAAAAAAAVSRLEPVEKAFVDAWTAAMRAAQGDLARAEDQFGTLLADARAWGREGELRRVRDEIAARLRAAESAWAGLSDNPLPEAIERFLAAHPGTPQQVPARTRLEAARTRLAQRDEGLAALRRQLDARQWPQAHRTARSLAAGFPGWIPADQLVIPLVVESEPEGATVLLDGRQVGQTPLPLLLRPAQAGEIAVEASGWDGVRVRLPDALEDWHVAVALKRRPLWQATIGRPAAVLFALPSGGVLALSADGLAAVGSDGRPRWRHGLGNDDLGGNRVRPGSLPALFPDGRVAIALPGGDVVVVDSAGNPRGRLSTGSEVRGRPLAYINEVFGPQSRLAVAGDALFTAAPGGDLLRIPLPRPAMAGPVAFPRDLDRVLVVATINGHLIGVEESTRRVLWDIDTQAADCGQLVAAGDHLLLAVLDGSRLAAWRVSGGGLVPAWSQPLGTTAVGDPTVFGGEVLVAAGREVRRTGIDGGILPSWTLPAPASSAPAAGGDTAAVGCQDGTLLVFRAGAQAWTTPCGKPVTAVAVLPGQVVAALSDGSLLAFPL